LSCVVFDNSTTDAANFTTWLNPNTGVLVPSGMIDNTRDGYVVTSVLTIESVSLSDNGTGYVCKSANHVVSFIGLILVIGELYT